MAPNAIDHLVITAPSLALGLGVRVSAGPVPALAAFIRTPAGVRRIGPA